jgi:hypothetical protein
MKQRYRTNNNEHVANINKIIRCPVNMTGINSKKIRDKTRNINNNKIKKK